MKRLIESKVDQFLRDPDLNFVQSRMRFVKPKPQRKTLIGWVKSKGNPGKLKETA